MRGEISRLAVTLFSERGFRNTTVGDVAAAAGLSERTFFRYFASKDDLLLDYERQMWERLVAALIARPLDEGPVTALREAFLATSHVEMRDRPRVVQLGRILNEAPEIRARSQGQRLIDSDQLVDLVANRFKGNKRNALPQARVIVSAMNAVAVREFSAWVDSGGRGDPAGRIRIALQMLETGLAQFESLPSGSA